MRASRGFTFAVAAFASMNFAVSSRAVLVLDEGFADDSQITAKLDGNSAVTFFNNGTNVYWGIHDPTGTTDDFDVTPIGTQPSTIPAFSFPTGSGNRLISSAISVGLGGASELPAILDWSGLNVAGLTNLTFDGLFAAATNGGFEAANDYIKVQYRFDGTGTFVDLLWFSPDGDTEGVKELALDDDMDGVGEGAALSLTATPYTRSITGTGTTLDLRLLMASTSTNDEHIAVDSFVIQGIPEPSAFLFGGLVCGVIGLAYVRQKLFGSKAALTEVATQGQA